MSKLVQSKTKPGVWYWDDLPPSRVKTINDNASDQNKNIQASGEQPLINAGCFGLDENSQTVESEESPLETPTMNFESNEMKMETVGGGQMKLTGIKRLLAEQSLKREKEKESPLGTPSMFEN